MASLFKECAKICVESVKNSSFDQMSPSCSNVINLVNDNSKNNNIILDDANEKYNSQSYIKNMNSCTQC